MVRTRPVNTTMYSDYFKKAHEFLTEAQEAFQNSRWNAVVVNSIHSAISAADSLTVFMKGLRSAGENHEDVIGLLKTLNLDDEEVKNKSKQLQRLLQIKNAAEYEEKLMSENDAENCLRDAERFLEWVKQKLASP